MGEIKTNSQLLWQLECQKYTSQFNHTDKDSKPPSLSVEEVHCVATSIIHSNNNNNLSDTNCLHSILNRENQQNCQWKWIQMDMAVPWNFMGKKWFKINWFLFFVVTMSMFFLLRYAFLLGFQNHPISRFCCGFCRTKTDKNSQKVNRIFLNIKYWILHTYACKVHSQREKIRPLHGE